MERHVAARVDHGGRTSGERAAKCRHADIVAHHQALQADQITNHFAHYNGRDGCGSLIIEGRQEDMGGHGERGVAQRHERLEVDRG